MEIVDGSDIVLLVIDLARFPAKIPDLSAEAVNRRCSCGPMHPCGRFVPVAVRVLVARAIIVIESLQRTSLPFSVGKLAVRSAK